MISNTRHLPLSTHTFQTVTMNSSQYIKGNCFLYKTLIYFHVGLYTITSSVESLFQEVAYKCIVIKGQVPCTGPVTFYGNTLFPFLYQVSCR